MFKIWVNWILLNNQDVGQQEKQWESSVGSIHGIMKSIWNMCKLTAKFIPHTCTLRFVLEFMANNKIAAIAHIPNSPDLAPCNFILFQNLKISLKGSRLMRSA
jgi:hypothetical protein